VAQLKNGYTVRGDIESAIKGLNIDRQDFHEVGKTKWHGILSQVVQTFVVITNYEERDNLRWAWERFKGPHESFVSKNNNVYEYLKNILGNEYVWFIAEDSYSKMWVYEAKADAIPLVLGETNYFEYYIVSKKLDWLLCENHHGYLSVVGEGMLNRCKAMCDHAFYSIATVG